jgi:hypothetical protein
MFTGVEFWECWLAITGIIMASHHVLLHLVRFGERINRQIIYNKSGMGFLIEGILS